MKKPLTAAFAVCLFFLVLGGKWATFDRFGSPMPDWDQWDAEAVELLIPWYARENFLTHLLHPHNEHRVLLTKLQNLALTVWNGQWDSRLEAVTNAMLHSLFAVAFWVYGLRWIATAASADNTDGVRPVNTTAPAQRTTAAFGAALFVLSAALFGLPLAWQNVLGGFHSQQYWLVLLSFAAIVAWPFARPWTAQWWAAALAAVLALGSMGSGFVAAAVVFLVVGWRLRRHETSMRHAWPTLAVSAILVAFGLLTRVDAPWHENIKAKTAHDFLFSIVHSLQWPWRHQHWAAVVMWLPWLLLAGRVLRPAAAPSPRFTALHGGATAAPDWRGAQTLLALGGWVLVQVLATAYARGAGAEYPASRYMDTLIVGAMVNGIALAWLLTPRAPSARRRAETFSRGELQGDVAVEIRSRARFAKAGRGPLDWVLYTVGVAWVLTFAFGLRDLMELAMHGELPRAKQYYIEAEGHMRRYLATNDPKHLSHPDIPYPSAEALAERLANPHLRPLMPVPLRAPLAMVAASLDDRVPPSSAVRAFLENDARDCDPESPPTAGLSPSTPPLDAAKTWGSFAPDGIKTGITGAWRSAPLTSSIGGWLKFETAGHLGNPNDGVALELRDAATDALITQVRPSRVPGDSWRAAYVRAPQKPFVVVARDQHPARWLAFSGPVEMGTLSYWAWRAAKNGVMITWLAAAATVAVAIAGYIRARRTSDHSTPTPTSRNAQV